MSYKTEQEQSRFSDAKNAAECLEGVFLSVNFARLIQVFGDKIDKKLNQKSYEV